MDRIGQPQLITLDMLMDTLDEIEVNGDKNADVSFARLFAKHGNGTEMAKRFAREYAEMD